ncbi:MAG: hypothetical protein L6U99_02610 [Clostridium sp.]|nr:MAG: hypothetical protein L6U99_02610 [Clostridium sp.]
MALQILFIIEKNTTFSNEDNIETGFYEKNDEAYLEITRLGQSINVLVNYKGKKL